MTSGLGMHSSTPASFSPGVGLPPSLLSRSAAAKLSAQEQAQQRRVDDGFDDIFETEDEEAVNEIAEEEEEEVIGDIEEAGEARSPTSFGGFEESAATTGAIETGADPETEIENAVPARVSAEAPKEEPFLNAPQSPDSEPFSPPATTLPPIPILPSIDGLGPATELDSPPAAAGSKEAQTPVGLNTIPGAFPSPGSGPALDLAADSGVQKEQGVSGDGGGGNVG